MVSSAGRRWQVGGVLVCTLAVLGLMWVVALAGCGSDAVGESQDQSVAAAQDECLFGGADNPEKASRTAAAGEEDSEKAYLPFDGTWIVGSVAEGSWVRHRIATKKGYTYLVTLCNVGTEVDDDPDLFISRDPDPYNNTWRSCSWGGPYADVIAFRSGGDGFMYVAVYGWYGGGDGNTYYAIQAQRRQVPPLG